MRINVDYIKSPELIDTFALQLGCLLNINAPTITSKKSATCIDQIFSKPLDGSAYIIKSDLSDHYSVLFQMKLKTKKCRKLRTVRAWKINSETLSSLKDGLQKADWDSIMTVNTCSISLERFYDIFKRSLEVPCPKQNFKQKVYNSSDDERWYSSELKLAKRLKKGYWNPFYGQETQTLRKR